LIQEAESGISDTPMGWTARINDELPPASRNAAQFLRQTLRKGAHLPSGCVDLVLNFLNVSDITECGTGNSAGLHQDSDSQTSRIGNVFSSFFQKRSPKRQCDANASRRAFTETRVFFMTDMNINQGTKNGNSLMEAVENAAKHQGVMTTIIGIGVDFDVSLTDRLACVRGANYFTAHSTDEFLHQMIEELDYLMAPLAFDMKVEIDQSFNGKEPEVAVVAQHVYGAPEPAKYGPRPAGTLARINSFFPSSTDAHGQTKGSMILCKLDQAPASGQLNLTTTYIPRSGGNVQQLHHQAKLTRSSDASALKGIALVRYVNAVRCYLADMRDGQHMPSTSVTAGIAHPQSTFSMETQVDMQYLQEKQAGHQQLAERALAASYCETFEVLEQYLEDVEAELKSFGDLDRDLSMWREKLAELRESCVARIKDAEKKEAYLPQNIG